MRCPRCGFEMGNGAKFCPNCGLQIGQPASQEKMVQLHCKNCGAVMNMDEKSRIAVCPYCGSKELISESDAAAAERIKSNAYKEVEMEKLSREKEREKRQEEQDRLQKFKKGKFSKFIILLFIICLLTTFIVFRNGYFLSGLIALVQCALFAFAWLKGMQIIKEKKTVIHLVFAIVGLILIIPFIFVTSRDRPRYRVNLNWPADGISAVLPRPGSKKGEVNMNSDTSFMADIYGLSREKYQAYVNECQKKGFVVESDDSSDFYSAYNTDGYDLKLTYDSSEKVMSILMDAPEKFGKIDWPVSGPASLLPMPKSNIGKIYEDTAHSFKASVAAISRDEFQKYIEECSSKGFNVDYQKNADSFTAENQDGCNLSVNYKGFNTISVSLEEPDQEATATAEAESVQATAEEASRSVKATTEAAATVNAAASTSEAKVNAAASTSAAAVQAAASTSAAAVGAALPADAPTATAQSAVSAAAGIRPEFKAAMDSYEAFFDKYCEFMKNYDTSNTSLSMLTDYANFMAQYSDAMAKLDAMGKEEMSDAESAYYLQVMARINQKLIEVAQ